MAGYEESEVGAGRIDPDRLAEALHSVSMRFQRAWSGVGTWERWLGAVSLTVCILSWRWQLPVPQVIDHLIVLVRHVVQS